MCDAEGGSKGWSGAEVLFMQRACSEEGFLQEAGVGIRSWSKAAVRMQARVVERFMQEGAFLKGCLHEAVKGVQDRAEAGCRPEALRTAGEAARRRGSGEAAGSAGGSALHDGGYDKRSRQPTGCRSGASPTYGRGSKGAGDPPWVSGRRLQGEGPSSSALGVVDTHCCTVGLHCHRACSVGSSPSGLWGRAGPGQWPREHALDTPERHGCGGLEQHVLSRACG